MTTSVSEQVYLRKIWDQGISLDTLLHWRPFDGDPYIEPAGPDHPHTLFFEDKESWEYIPELRERFSNGVWIAVGYRAPRRKTTLLGIVPQAAFIEANFYETHSQVQGDGFSYVGVRIVHASVLEDSRDVMAPRPGRPKSDRRLIEEAYETLMSKGEIRADSSLRSMYSPIRSHIAKTSATTPDALKGYGNEVIRKALKQLMDRPNGDQKL